MIARNYRTSTSHGGGVMIAYNENLISTEITIKPSTEISSSSIHCRNSDLSYMNVMWKSIKLYHSSSICMGISRGQTTGHWLQHQFNHHKLAINKFISTMMETDSEQIVNFPTRYFHNKSTDSNYEATAHPRCQWLWYHIRRSTGQTSDEEKSIKESLTLEKKN